MAIDYLNLGMRLLHLFAAFTAVGGAIFIRFALLPALAETESGVRADVHAKVRPRWAKIVGIAIGLLLISGLVNYIMFVRSFKELHLTWGETWANSWRDTYASTYHMLFGVKFSLALVMFFLASALSGKAAGLQKIRDNARFWLNVNLVLALALVVVSGVMRQTHAGLPAPAGYKIQAELNTATEPTPASNKGLTP
jgi:uncharacterized membrane protein